MKIVKLAAENVKRLRAVEVQPNGDPLVVVGGRNAQGKSSVLDSIMYALGGAGGIPSQPVRRGAKKATVEVDLGDLRITRTMTADGGGGLTVTDKSGAKQASPQKLLDRLYAAGAFDPMEYTRLDPKAQAERLRVLAGLDTSAIDAERKAAFDARTDCARDGKALAAQLAAMPEPAADAPTEEVSVAELAAALRAATEARESAMAEHARLASTMERTARNHAAAIARAEDARAAEIAAELALATARERKTAALVDVESARTASAEAELAYAKAGGLPSTAAEEAALAGAEEHNRQARQAAERRKLSARVDAARAEHRKLTQQIERCDERRAEAIAACKMPVPGLAISDAGVVTLGGLPLDQASAAEQMRVSVAIGLAQHPQLRVMLVRDGSLLDDESLRLLAEVAAEHDAQVWVERVGAGAECSVVIEDGEVATTA